jgi:hypothetical protein
VFLIVCVRVVVNNSPCYLLCAYRILGKHAQAEELYLRVVHTYEALHGSEHALTVTVLNSLAVLYFSMHNHASAKPLFQRVYKCTEQALGSHHPDTLVAMENLASSCEALGMCVCVC